MKTSRESLGSLARACLEELEYEGGITADDMTTRMGISRPASALPGLEELERAGWARRDGAGYWWLA